MGKKKNYEKLYGNKLIPQVKWKHSWEKANYEN